MLHSSLLDRNSYRDTVKTEDNVDLHNLYDIEMRLKPKQKEDHNRVGVLLLFLCRKRKKMNEKNARNDLLVQMEKKLMVQIDLK